MQTACIGPCFREPILLNIFHLAPSHSPILGLLLAAYGTSRRKTEQPIRNLLLDFKHGAAGKERESFTYCPLLSPADGPKPHRSRQRWRAFSRSSGVICSHR